MEQSRTLTNGSGSRSRPSRQAAPVVGVVWERWRPYHFARFDGLCGLARRGRVYAIELSNLPNPYDWSWGHCETKVIKLCPEAVREHPSFRRTFQRMRGRLTELGIRVCLLPSYSPKQSLAALLAAKSLGIRTVMMNESHAGTARARGLAALVKRQLVGLFDSALVGGAPQRRYFASLGLPQERIFTGYDAVENEYFAERAAEIRTQPAEMRTQYALPEHYFLSLGRFVPKKNLETLLRAYGLFLDGNARTKTHLVMVGCGEKESRLKELCTEYGLRIYEKSNVPGSTQNGRNASSNEENRILPGTNGQPGVHFYGFRRIEENPVFYALADAFVLPSLWEEWGLVVNEAMASGLPVVVSNTAGCAEDLLEAGYPGNYQNLPASRLAQEFGLDKRIRQNGLVFDPKSSNELSLALLLLESSAELRSAMAQAGQRIIKKFSCAEFGENAVRAIEAAMA